ncbi:N-acetylglucosamine-induced 1 2 protein [Rutstroemia sp. NJR-2017a BVV2]|nr:N-acetylglucosamine-induced 1 2 protein [Rutstroemia sp. NJR-2017a BVV2]
MGELLNEKPQEKENAFVESPFPLTDIDRWVLSQTDEEFHLHDWEELKKIIAENNLSILKRKPSDLRRYMAWSAEVKAEYGSMMNYLLQHRLPWGAPPFTYNSPIPFDDLSDFKVLLNDWPYGLTKDITHIVVWSKTPIATDETTGDVTDESRKLINDFVKRTFVDRLGGDRDRVMWFKNWVALQSVRALEHVHVLVKDVTDADIEFWTGRKP